LPPGFVMSVKAPRVLTHGKKLYAPGQGGQDRRRLARAAGQACGDCRCGVRVGVWATSSRASTPAPNPPARSTCVGGRSSGSRASRGADRGVRSGGSTPLSTMGTTARWTPRRTPITSVARRRSRWTVSFARLCLAGRPEVGDAGCSEERDPDMASPALGSKWPTGRYGSRVERPHPMLRRPAFAPRRSRPGGQRPHDPRRLSCVVTAAGTEAVSRWCAVLVAGTGGELMS